MPSGIYERTEKIREGLRKRVNGMLGKNHSEDTKQKMSKSQGGKPGTMRGRHHSPETIRKMQEVQKWNSRKDAPSKHLQKLEKIAGRARSNTCEICKLPGKICFDHNHLSGKFRGWICPRCNLTLGLIKDSLELLEQMIVYLKNN